MNTLRNRAITAVTAVAALAIGVVPAAFTATSILASGEEATTSVAPAASLDTPPRLVLETGASNRVFLDSNRDGLLNSGESAQGLAGDPRTCLLVSDERLLAFKGSFTGQRGSADPASFAVGSLGVAEKKTGTSCYQVDTPSGDALTLSPGADLAGSYLFDSAALDLDLKQSAAILATAFRDADGDGLLEAGEVVRTYELQSGASVGRTSSADEVFKECKVSADSGPDSGSSDNCRWPIDSVGDGRVFDALVLKALVGSFSLEGGADGAPTGASVFELAYGELCVGDTRTLEATGTSPGVTVTRLGDAGTQTGECFVYRFEHAGQGAELTKRLEDSASAQFVFDFVWTVEADTTVNDDAVEDGLVNRTTVDFDGSGDGDGPTPLSSCPDLTTTTVGGIAFPVVSNIALNDNAKDLAKDYPIADDPATVGINEDTKQFACIVSQSIDPIPGTNNVEVTERIYAYGDILLKKG